MTETESAVKIAVRERPLNAHNNHLSSSVITYHASNENILIVDERPFAFDYTFNPAVSQEVLFNNLIKPLVEKAIQGFNCTALAYGQTGTGKTFTMGLQAEELIYHDVGMVPRALKDIFSLSNENYDRTLLEIFVSFIEIYNEKVYDLLADDTSEQINIKGYKFSGGLKVPVYNIEQSYEILVTGNKNRHVRPTKMNSNSSRSHAIFTIHLSSKTENSQISSCLHFVDLAGSEGVRRTGHQGVALAEGVHINQGLLSIGKVLQALTVGGKVIPYRDSVLSSVLQDSLNSKSFLTLLACISPYKEDISETLSTLRFAQNAKSLKSNPEINSILLSVKKNTAKALYNCAKLPLRVKNDLIKEPTPTKSAFRAASNDILHSSKKHKIHGNTFCTPSKVKKVDAIKFNQSDWGVIHNEQRKHTAVRESQIPIDDISRSSILSLNMSTSTTIEAPIINSYSPVVRRCMIEFENAMENKIQKMVEALKCKNTLQTNINENTDTTPNQEIIDDENLDMTDFLPKKLESLSNASNIIKLPWSSIKTQLKNIVRTEISNWKEEPKTDTELCDNVPTTIDSLKRNLFSASSPVQQEIGANADSIRIPSEEASGIGFSMEGNNTILRLRKSRSLSPVPMETGLGSPIFKIPDLPKPKIKAPNSDSIDEFANITLARGKRRSARFSKTPISNSIKIPTRRSLRLSTSIMKDNINYGLSGNRRRSERFSGSFSVSKTSCRRSARLSLSVALKKNVHDCSKNGNETKNSTSKTAKKISAAPTNNAIIAAYFKVDKNNAFPIKMENAKIKHKKAVLDLLNSGSMKELQILPQIGLKTAYQIITYRTLNGKFKSCEQLSKLPIWRGKSWERFQVANNL